MLPTGIVVYQNRISVLQCCQPVQLSIKIGFQCFIDANQYCCLSKLDFSAAMLAASTVVYQNRISVLQFCQPLL